MPPKKALTVQEDKARRDKQKKEEADRIKAKIEKEQETRAAKQQEMARQAEAAQCRAAEKAKKISEYVQAGNKQVKAIVDEVKRLRSRNPTVNGINAGMNAADIGNTIGGTDNPLRISIPRNDYGIALADVARKMNGFDNSDSGIFKFRIGDIFVHAQ